MSASEDHRTRVAALRREKMRARLLESALQVVATDGRVALSIDRLIQHAGVSRGTFYKYYDAPAGVIRELAVGISNELIELAEPMVLQVADPAARVASGLRALLHLCTGSPILGRFLLHLGWPDLDGKHLMFRHVKRDIEAAQRLGRFKSMPTDLALCLVGVTAVAGIQVLLTSSEAGEDLPQQTSAAVLRALGMADGEAERLAALPLVMPSLPATGLIHRASRAGAGAPRTV
jgi:AcrR family transcriptional regulator